MASQQKSLPIPSAYANPILERQVLNIYGLDESYPTQWIDSSEINLNAVISLPIHIITNKSYHISSPTYTAQSSHPSLLDDQDPLKLLPSIFTNENKHIDKHHICISHKDFIPKKFLAHVHPNASYKDLDFGLAQLTGFDHVHSNSMKKLICEHFDEFVFAKATIDDAFRGWIARELDPATNYGTDDYSDTLKLATKTIKQVFQPILDRRTHADKIKSTLSVLDRFKFFFNLPNTVRTHIQSNRFDMAVHDYKKGKALITSMYKEFDHTQTTTTNTNPLQAVATVKSFHAQQRLLFEKIWTQVMHVMNGLKDRLLKQLTEQHAIWSVEEQELAIQLVMEIDPIVDPVWVYLESRFKYILGQLKERFSMWYRDMPSKFGTPVRFTEVQLRRAVHLRNKKEYDALFANDPEVQIWSSRTILIGELTQCLVVSLPDFWKLAKAYIEGKYQTPKHPHQQPLVSPRTRGVPSLDMAKVEHSHRMVRDMASYFGTLIQHALTLTPVGGDHYIAITTDLISSPTSSNLASLPSLPLLPLVNSVTLAVYAPQMVALLHTCAKSIQAALVPPDTLMLLLCAMDRCKAGVLDMMLTAWSKDVTLIPAMNNTMAVLGNNSIIGTVQSPSKTSKSGHVSPCITLFASFQKKIVQSAFKIAHPIISPSELSNIIATSLTNPDSHTANQDPALSNLIAPAFFETLALFLDTLHIQANPVDQQVHGRLHQGVAEGDNRNMTLLQVMCDLNHLQLVIFPSLVQVLESFTQTKLADDKAHFMQLIEQLDNLFLGRVIHQIVEVLNRVIKSGFVGSDWMNITMPTEIRAWVYNVLLHLVNTHALITRVFPPAVPRVFSEIFGHISQSVLNQVRQIELTINNQGALMQLMVEVQFLHRSLAPYQNPIARDSLNDVYSILNGLYRPSSYSPESSVAAQMTETSLFKQILSHAFQSTKLQFACFS